MRQFFIDHADDLYIPESDANDAAILMSYRSDLWTSQAISPARYVADLLEDLNQPYDVLLPERDDALDRLGEYKLIVAPHAEILSDAWFDALQRYLDGGGTLITTGNAAVLDENLSPRKRRWSGARWRHFEQRVEKQFADSRKTAGIHHAFTGPAGEFAGAIRRALASASVLIDPPQPYLTINHTILPDGEAIHLVNRYVNLFTQIRLRRRDGVVLKVTPRRAIRELLWLSAENQPAPLTFSVNTNAIKIELPPIEAYGVLRFFYRENSPTSS